LHLPPPPLERSGKGGGGRWRSCTSNLTVATNKTLYSWYDYEKISYIYTKKNTEEVRGYALEEYKKVIDHQVSLRKTVPPGIYAEYGCMLYKSGRKKDGLKYIKEEAKLYPESEKYISKLIKQLEQ